MHARLHSHPVLAPLNGEGLTRSSYGLALQALYGIHSAADTLLAAQWPDRSHRSPLIAADLAVLGDLPNQASAASLPPITELAAAVGMRYVVDGSSFGAKVLLGNVQKILGFNTHHGGLFFSGGHIDIANEWRKVLYLLDELEYSTDRGSVLQTAADTFQAIENWLNHQIGLHIPVIEPGLKPYYPQRTDGRS